MKKTILLPLVLVASGLHAGPLTMKNPAPSWPMQQELFGPGMHIGAHALYLTPDADRADDTLGGGINFDWFFTRNMGFQASGAWADPGTGEVWHNYTVDFVVRAPFEAWHIAPYAFVGGGVILEDSAELLGRAGIGIEYRPTERFGIFADWVYNFPGGGGGGDDLEDYQMIRAGIKVGL